MTHPPLLPTELACCFTPDLWPFLRGMVIVADGAQVTSRKASGSRGMRLPVLLGRKLLVFFKWGTLQQRIDKICLSLHAQYHQEHSLSFFFLSLLKYNLCTVKCVLCRCSVLCVLTNTQSSGLSEWLGGKESTCQCQRRRRLWFDPWVQKIPWSRKWQPVPVFLAGKSHARGAWQVMLQVLQRV